MASNIEFMFGPSSAQRGYDMAKSGMQVGYQPSRSALAAALRGLTGFGSGIMAGYQGSQMDKETKGGLGQLLANKAVASASPPAALDAVKAEPTVVATPEAPELPPPPPLDPGAIVPAGTDPAGVGGIPLPQTPMMPFFAGKPVGTFQTSSLAQLLGNRYA